MRQRVEAAAGDLDQVLRLLRDTVFGLEQRLRDRGLRREILDLCEDLSPTPEVSFSGPVDGALHPGTGTWLVQLLREALAVIGPDAVPASISVTTGEDACPHGDRGDGAAACRRPGLGGQETGRSGGAGRKGGATST